MRIASTLALVLVLAAPSTGCLLVNDYDRFSRGEADAGASDARTPDCEPDPEGEHCNGADDDCDGRIDEDPRECVAGPNVVAACVDGVCQPTGCVDGWASCTTDNACETEITSNRTSCGRCENVCGATSVCRAGDCHQLDADWFLHASSPTVTWISDVALRGERVVAVGYHSSTSLTLGGSLVATQSGAFITVRSLAGAPRGAATLDGTSVELLHVAVNEEGTIYVAGTHRTGDVRLGGTQVLPGTTLSTTFVAAFTPALELSWIVRAHGTGPVIAAGLELDAGSRGVWLAATYVDGVSLDEDFYGPGHGTLVAHFDGDGEPSIVRTHRWTRETTEADVFSPLPGGGYVLGGFVVESEQLAPPMVYEPNGIEAFVIAYDASGTPRWVSTLPTDEGSSYTLALAPHGEIVYVGAYVDGRAGAFDGEGGIIALAASDGSTLWQRPLGAGGDAVYAIAVAPDGDLVVGGKAFPGINIGTGTPSVSLPSDGMLARLGPDRTTTRWLYTFGGRTSNEDVNAVAVGPDGDVYAAGSFSGVMTVGGTEWTSDTVDGFLLRLTP